MIAALESRKSFLGVLCGCLAQPGCRIWCRYAPQPTFVAAERTFSVAMDALLVGHEDWVFSAVWQPQLVAGTMPCLLTASMDRTMMLWRPEPSAGVHCLNGNMKAAMTRSCSICAAVIGILDTSSVVLVGSSTYECARVVQGCGCLRRVWGTREPLAWATMAVASAPMAASLLHMASPEPSTCGAAKVCTPPRTLSFHCASSFAHCADMRGCSHEQQQGYARLVHLHRIFVEEAALSFFPVLLDPSCLACIC